VQIWTVGFNMGLVLQVQGDTHKAFGFGDWQAFPLRNLLVGPPGEIHIEPKVMQVLQQLAGNPGQVVERDKLLNDIWDGGAYPMSP
jgi:DNA-binding winged helix-turn-helix (wHTH) protein